jgi:Na+-transporting NADH:ubiquinone oxidoreductase subunit NqrA
VGKGGHGKRRELFSFLWKRKRKSSILNRVLVHHITVSTVTRVEFSMTGCHVEF